MLKTHLQAFDRHLSEFRRDERGSMTVFGLLFFLTSCIAGAIAVDISNVYAQRTHLQTAADQAGHAAIYNLWTSTDPASLDNQNEAIGKARAIARETLGKTRTGGDMADEDIQVVFGDWDFATQTFTPGLGQHNAVRVSTAFRGSNAVATFLFRLAGIDDFDVYAESVWHAYINGCFTSGFIAQGTLDIASNNSIGGEFCFVSNTEVTKNNNNSWGDFGLGVDPSLISEDTVPNPSAIVIMPEAAFDDAMLDGNAGNVGWTSSLVGYGETRIPLLPRMQNMMYDEFSSVEKNEVDNAITSFFGGSAPYGDIIDDKIVMPLYVDDPTLITPIQLSPGGGQNSTQSLTPLTMDTLNMAETGKIYYVDCPQNGTLNIDMDPSNIAYVGKQFIEEMVIMTTCKLDFAQGSLIESGRFIVLNNDSNGSVTAASGVTFGKKENNPLKECEDPSSAGVQIFTMGSAKFPAAFDAFGMQMVAMGDVQMASGSGGSLATSEVDFIGSSIISGGDITLTTQMNIKVECYPASGDTPNPEFFRMVN